MPLGEIVGLALIGVGAFFSVVGIIGIVRLPDVYCRIHASGKVAILGVVGLLAGAAALIPEITLKLAVLALFLVISSPVAAHAVAAAAHRQGVPPADVTRNDLAQMSQYGGSIFTKRG